MLASVDAANRGDVLSSHSLQIRRFDFFKVNFIFFRKLTYCDIKSVCALSSKNVCICVCLYSVSCSLDVEGLKVQAEGADGYKWR